MTGTAFVTPGDVTSVAMVSKNMKGYLCLRLYKSMKNLSPCLLSAFCNPNGGNHFPKVLYILRTVFWCCIWFQQGAGLELQRVTSRDREKSMLDRQHEHLIRCLEKATVSKHKKNENKYWIVSPSDNPITTILNWPLLPQDKTSWYLKEWYRSPAHMWLGRNIIRQLHIEESLCQQHSQSI